MDPALNFVISPRDVGDDPFPKGSTASSKESYLYDCRHVDVRKVLPGFEK
jgi:hypothetical protein